MYTYNAKFVRAVDGDTVILDVDLGFYVSLRQTFRIKDIDTPEMRGDSLEAARIAKQFVDAELRSAKEIKITCYGRDKYGRWIANVSYIKENSEKAEILSIRDVLLENNHGVAT